MPFNKLVAVLAGKRNRAGEKDSHPENSKKSPSEEPAPKDLWQDAFNSLSGPKQEKLGLMGMDQLMSGPIESSIGDLVDIVNKRQEECEKKFWKLKVSGDEIILRNYTTRIVDWLEKTVDIAVQFAPPQASAPWAVLKVFLQVPVIEGEQMAALLATTEKIVRVISRGHVYETVYLKNLSAAPTDTLSKNLELGLKAIYTTSLELLADSETLFSKNTAQRTLEVILKPGKFAGVLSSFSKQEDELLRDVEACETRRKVNADDSMVEMLQALNTPIARMGEDIRHLLQNVSEQERIEMLEWISPVPFGKNHNNVKERRTPGTGEWLLQKEEFRDWDRVDSSVLFLLYGLPGRGKTYLTSTVIDLIQDRLISRPKHDGFAFFYCDKSEPKRAQPLSILQSIVRQLSTTVKSPESTQTSLYNLYKKCRKAGSDLTFRNCKEQILASLNIYQKSTLIIDAVDECDPETHDQLIDFLNVILRESKNPVKIFISSRPDMAIQKKLEKVPSLSISASDNTEDIHKYLDIELDRLESKSPFFKHIRSQILNTLLERSQGMFQWAVLQVRQIGKCKTQSSVSRRLQTLPKDLQEAYNETWSQIEELEKPDQILAIRTMLWIIAADKPLTSSQLIAAVRVNTNGKLPVLADEIDEQGLLSLSNNLLTIDSQLGVWRFAHLSVREYLEIKMQWTSSRAHLHAATACLSWFINFYGKSEDEDGSEEDGDVEMDTDNISHLMHPFHIYMRHQWPKHVQSAQDSEEALLSSLLKIFLGSPEKSSLQYQRWYQLTAADFEEIDQIPDVKPYDDVHYVAAGIDESGLDTCDFNQANPLAWEEFSSELSPEQRPVFAMCHFSFADILSSWWKDAEFDPAAVNGRGHNLLTLAARAGCTPICKSLVEKGVDVNLQIEGQTYGSALEAAAHRGHIETVKFLIEAGADVNMTLEHGKYGNALIAAVSAQRIETAKYLIHEAHADVDKSHVLEEELFEDDEEPITMLLPVAIAAKFEDTELLQTLVDAGANVNVPEQCGNAMAVAFRLRNIKGAEYLIQKAGADVNLLLEGASFRTVLERAVSDDNNLEAVKCLVEAGADVNPTEYGEYGPPLAAAAFGYNARGSNIDMVKYLVGAGADIHKKLEETSLVALAVSGKDIEVVKFLVDAGAEINVQEEFLAAVNNSFLDGVRYMVQKGADVNMSLHDGRYGSVLEKTAAEDRTCEITRCLIEGGADVNKPSENGEYGSPLAAAAASFLGGDTESIKLLISHGAEVNLSLQHGNYGSALAAAAASDYNIGAVKCLVEAGADVNLSLRGGRFGSGLAAAASQREVEHVKCLLDAGADVNQPLNDRDFGSALALASAFTSIDIMNCLVEAGAQVDSTHSVSKYGSPLISASAFGETESIERLIDAGADVNLRIPNSSISTALQAAQSSVSQEGIPCILQASGRDVDEVARTRSEAIDLLKQHGATT